MSSESEDVFEPSLRGTPGIRLIRRSQKAKDKGLAGVALTSKHSQETRWISITLKVQPMVNRNEVTYCLLLIGRYQVGANRMRQIGEIELEANALGNTKDMLTNSR